MHSFDNRTISISEFSSCVTSGGRLCQSCSVLQNDSSRDFQHSKQCKYKEEYLSKFSKAHKRKQTYLLAKVNSRCFFFQFPATMLMSLRMSNNSSTENRTDLRLGQSPYLFIVYNVSISWLHSLNVFFFILMAWQWKPAIRRNVCLNFRKFTRENKPLFWQKWTPDVFSYFRPPCLCSSEGHKYGVSIPISINLYGTLCQITRVR